MSAESIASRANRFAARLHGVLRSRPDNLVYSPGSLWVALTMTLCGARGRTREEMSRVLGPIADGDISAVGEQLRRWNLGGGDAFTLRMCNRLFGDRTYSFESPFVQLMSETFDAPLEHLDFRALEAARARINGWVEERTERRIENLLPEGGLDPETRLVLANAIYFLARWTHPFEPDSTRDAPFFGPAGRAMVATMRQVDELRYGEPEGLQVLELPYEGSDFAMIICLPREPHGLPEVESRFVAGELDAWLDTLAPRRVALSLPKFTIDPTEAWALAETLVSLGMSTAFDRFQADFTTMANPPSPDDRLFVSQVFHKAFVKVDEAGTEAAAATAVLMALAGSMPDPEPPVEFRADHPFLFFLRDVRSGLLLFAGRLVDPRPDDSRATRG